MPQPRVPDALPDDLLGADAARWLLSRRWGPALLDDALGAAATYFGLGREIGAWVPADPLTRRHSDFYLQIKGRVEVRRDWDRIVSVYEALEIARERRLDDQSFDRAFRRFHPVLTRSVAQPTMPGEAIAAWYRQ